MILVGEVNEDMLCAVVEGYRDGEYFLCTPGGSIDVARAITDLMRGASIVAAGTVASSGIPIFAAGGTRQTLPSTSFLWHAPSIVDGTQLRADDLAIHAGGMRAWFQWACRHLGERTKRSAAFWAELGSHAGTEFTAHEALKFGLVDSIVLYPVERAFNLGETRVNVPRGQRDGRKHHGYIR